MKILILAIHYPVASGRYMLDALRRMGHEVYSAGPSTGNEIWGMTVDPKYVWLADDLPDGWQPDLVIIADSWLQPGRKIHIAPHVVYGVDNHVRDYHQFNEIAEHFFLAHGHGARIGEDNVTWLPCAYDPAVFTPGQAWADRPTDWAMIGVMYGKRSELLYKLLSDMPNARGEYGVGAIYDQYADIYQRSKISVVSSAAGDVAQRVWETAAMGCLLVMDECADGPALGLVDNENCLIYHTTNEAIEKIRWALANQDEAEQIARAGQEWAQDGTWDNRLKVIVDRYAPKAQKESKK